MPRHLCFVAFVLSASIACSPTDAQIVVTPVDLAALLEAENRMAFDDATDSLRNVDFRVAEGFRPGGNGARFAQTLMHVMEGRYSEAIEQVRVLQDSASGGLQVMAFQIHQGLLREERRYADWLEAQRAFKSVHPEYEPEALAAMLHSIPEEAFSFAEPAFQNELTLSSTGSPLVKVEAHGVEKFFWFDTGASFSLVATSLADSLGVIRAADDALEITTSTTKRVGAQLGYLPNLRLGHLHAQNHPVFLMDDADLTFEMNDGSTLKIEGIIGWNLIRHMRVVLNYERGTYTVTASTPDPALDRNLYWLGYPLVTGMTETGQPLLFGLDTGSRNTSLDDNIFRKTTFSRVVSDSVRIGGAGGFEWLPSQIATDFRFIVSDHLFHMPRAQSEVHDDVIFLAIDGVLGSDIARHMRMVVDFPNAHFGLSLVE